MRTRAAAAALLLLLAVGASGCTAGQVRQVALPNQLVPVWSAAIEPGYAPHSTFAITSTIVIVPAPNGDLALLEPQTGRLERSIAPDPGWHFGDITVIGKRLYTYLTTPNVADTRIAAYDLGTGRAIWRTDLTAVDSEMVTSRGIVVQEAVIQPPGPDLLQGLRLSDGEGTWLTRLPSSCYNGYDSTVTPSAAVFLLVCPSGDRLITIDPADGHISWQRTFAASYPIDLLATNLGDIFAEAGTTMHIFTSSGRTIATRGPPLSCPAGSCSISTGANGPLGVRFELGENSDVFQGINLSTGHVLWQRTAEPVENPFVALDSDGILFGMTVPYRFGIGGPYGLLPDFVLTMQASTGRSTVLPLPLAGSVIVGTTANLLMVLSQGGRNAVITALRAEDSAMSGPAVLGGVTPATWPDACKLLMPADLRFIAAGYIPVPRTVTLPGVTWRKPVTCAYTGPGTGDPAVTLHVAWIAASNQQEDELLGSYLRFLSGISPGPPLRIPGGYLVYDRTVAGGVDQALIAAGRAIVTVTVPGHPGDARRLAPLVAARLRAAYGTG